jgi:hypothetical protein
LQRRRETSARIFRHLGRRKHAPHEERDLHVEPERDELLEEEVDRRNDDTEHRVHEPVREPAFPDAAARESSVAAVRETKLRAPRGGGCKPTDGRPGERSRRGRRGSREATGAGLRRRRAAGEDGGAAHHWVFAASSLLSIARRLP